MTTKKRKDFSPGSFLDLLTSEERDFYFSYKKHDADSFRRIRVFNAISNKKDLYEDGTKWIKKMARRITHDTTPCLYPTAVKALYDAWLWGQKIS